ncbi:MAG: hypothetical protein EPN97_12415 [Alphaproteobacteria bacterium]|nr:MAG: hypothetical protein EPN97_12415 [Alphaproteobacteria bacterium]
MAITIEELDGKYEVFSQKIGGGTNVPDGDGTTEIRNGLTYRKDKNGFIWESAFTIAGADQVQMESTIDPSHAGADKFIKDEKGNLTKGMLTYRAILNATRDNGKLVLKGDINHGGEITRLTLKKIS